MGMAEVDVRWDVDLRLRTPRFRVGSHSGLVRSVVPVGPNSGAPIGVGRKNFTRNEARVSGERMADILIVDDSPTIRRLMRAALEAVGHRVVEAPCGEAALPEIARHTPSLVITDLNMGAMTGIHLLAEIRKAHSAGELPVIVMTTEDGEAVKDQARKLGAAGWVIKPVQGPKLQSIVAQVLARRSAA